MANPITNFLIKAEVRFTWNEQQVENVLHWSGPSAIPSATELDTLATVIDNNVITTWLPLMAAGVTYREIYTESYQGINSISRSLATGGIGGATGESMAGNNTFCLSFRTGFTGRRRRGRFYTIGMSENAQSAGVVSSAYRTGWLSALNQLIIDGENDNFNLVVASFVATTVIPAGPVLITPVTTVIAVDDFCDSQRRRLRGRGQ